ncbi:hypothetical protein [Paenibacillus mendelii]|uniref:Uncharacterized protein n=1 Tax=Paenibacillus mendelii TaxID=206163 RepID=A0ABV6JE88_9BACL|nr:hypothetical protein [Paenibacillus mendelii]MCQ6557089.1 hypothetical protein [Paenibacillus mendelii]
MTVHMMKPPPEVIYERELEALRALDQGLKPMNWLLSPARGCDRPHVYFRHWLGAMNRLFGSSPSSMRQEVFVN